MINLTPHSISVYLDGKLFRSYPSNGLVRLVEKRSQQVLETVDGIAVVGPPKYEGLIGFEPFQNSTEPILVSMPVGDYFSKHPELYKGDVLGPDTSPDSCVYDENGKILGCKRFISYKRKMEVAE